MSKGPTSAHDAWLKSTLGLDTAKPTSTGAPPLPPAPPDKQSQQFRTDYEAALAPFDAAIAYLSSHASEEKKTPVASKRDVLFNLYETALTKVDPADEAKGKPTLDKALVGVKAAAANAGMAQQAAEKLFNDWTTREPKLEEVAGQIEEMEEWGYEKVGPLRSQLDALEQPAEAREFDVASAAADQLLAAMGPVVDDFEKQKAAKEKYHPLHETLKPRLEKVGTCTHVKLATERDEIGTGAGDMEASEKAKNYVDALAKIENVTTQVGTFEMAVTDLDKRKAEFDAAWKALQEKLRPADESTYKKLIPDQDAITAAKAPIEAAGNAEEFDKATPMMAELEGKFDAFVAARTKLDEEKAIYDKAWEGVQPKLAQTDKATYKSLDGQRQDLVAAQSSIKDSVQQEEFAQAATLVEDLSKKCDAFIEAAAKIDEAKTAFEKPWSDVQDKLGKLQPSPATFKTLQPALDEIYKSKTDIEAAVEVDNYKDALPMVGDLSNKVDVYTKKVEDKTKEKEEFDQADAELGVLRMGGVEKVSAASLAPQVTDIQTTLASSKAAIDAEDYKKALEFTNAAKGKVSALRAEAEKLRKAINDKVDSIETEVAQLDVGDHPIKVNIDELIKAIRAEAATNEQLDKAEKDLAELPTLVQKLKDDPAAKLRNNPDYQTKLRTEQEALDQREVARADLERAKAAYNGTKVPTMGGSFGLSPSGVSGGVTASGDPASPSVKLKEVELATAKLNAADNKLETAYKERVKLMQKASLKPPYPERGQDYRKPDVTDILKN